MPVDSLFISDLDGTLLNRGGELSETSREGLQRLLEQGTNFTVASARSYFSIRSILGPLPFVLPVIEFNGAFITDYSTGEHLQINALARDQSQSVFDLIEQAGLRPFVSTFNEREDCLYFDELINFGMNWYAARRRQANDPRLRQIADLRDALLDQVVSLTVMDSDLSAIRKLEQVLFEQLGDQVRTYCYENEYSKGTYWLTIHDPRANKQLAMQHLRERFAPGSLIVAFGDNYNDLEMVKMADRGVAVENAVPQLKALADVIIGDCDDDSVIRYLLAEAGEVSR